MRQPLRLTISESPITLVIAVAHPRVACGCTVSEESQMVRSAAGTLGVDSKEVDGMGDEVQEFGGDAEPHEHGQV